MEENCFHCGQRIEEEVIQFDEKDFCCQGCKTVYEILNVNNLKIITILIVMQVCVLMEKVIINLIS